MKKLLPGLMVFSLLCIGTAQAQVSPVSATTEAPMTWTTLSNMAKAAETKAAAANKRMDEAVTCGKKGKVYSTATIGSDTQGCLEASSANGTNLTSMVNTLSAMNKTVTNLNSNMNILSARIGSVISCGASGSVFNGSSCVPAGSPVPAGTMCGASSLSNETGRAMVYSCNGMDPKNGCPQGFTRAIAQIWGGKNGQNIAYCFKQ